jgi:hypothetical protein
MGEPAIDLLTRSEAISRLKVSERTAARFRSKLGEFVKQPEQAGLTPCIRWKGNLDRWGHGSFWMSRRLSASRASYEIFVGPVPHGLVVRHRCDNGWCVNPLHLEIGTHADNVRDRVDRGRSATGDRSGPRRMPETRPRGDAHYSRTRPHLVPRGERASGAKLVATDVLSIRSAYASGEPMRDLATRYTVTKRTIAYIVARRTWRHV